MADIEVTLESPASIEAEVESNTLHIDAEVIYMGRKGDKGEKGDKGDTGEKGDRGEQGIQGIQGIQR